LRLQSGDGRQHAGQHLLSVGVEVMAADISSAAVADDHRCRSAEPLIGLVMQV
jgi:hypothetical protein